MTQEQVDRIGAFVQFDRELHEQQGTGLGLSICKELVELNKGKIWVESTVNVGTTFYVQLPKSRPS